MISPNEQRVWNRLKNSEKFYRDRLSLQIQKNDSLQKAIALQNKKEDQYLNLIKMQQEENILWRKQDIFQREQIVGLEKDVSKYKKRSKRRLGLAVGTFFIGAATTFIVPKVIAP